MAQASPNTSIVASIKEQGARLAYLPGLDGLRALAVTAVLFYHADVPWMPGGFLGVEIFFVISGYLITSLLLTEWQRDGSVNLKHFWLRRARRLLPALYALLIAALTFCVLFLPEEVAGLRSDAAAAFSYITNWYLILAQQSYFEFVGRPSLLQHLWSLAVEEQFYLLFPLAFALVLGRLKRRRAFVVVLTVALLSAAWMAIQYQPDTDPSRIYYGTDTRAAGILLGAALAFIWTPWAKQQKVKRFAGWALDGIGVIALGLLVLVCIQINEFEPFLYQGGMQLVSLLTVILIAAVVNPSSVLGMRLLAWAPLVWIGLRSYGIYLWHWFVFDITRPQLDVRLDGLPLFVLRIGATLILAELSYHFIETPIRSGALGRAWATLGSAQGVSRRRLRLRWATTLAVILLFGLMLGNTVINAQEPPPPDYLTENNGEEIVPPSDQENTTPSDQLAYADADNAETHDQSSGFQDQAVIAAESAVVSANSGELPDQSLLESETPERSVDEQTAVGEGWLPAQGETNNTTPESSVPPTLKIGDEPGTNLNELPTEGVSPTATIESGMTENARLINESPHIQSSPVEIPLPSPLEPDAEASENLSENAVSPIQDQNLMGAAVNGSAAPMIDLPAPSIVSAQATKPEQSVASDAVEKVGELVNLLGQVLGPVPGPRAVTARVEEPTPTAVPQPITPEPSAVSAVASNVEPSTVPIGALGQTEDSPAPSVNIDPSQETNTEMDDAAATVSPLLVAGGVSSFVYGWWIPHPPTTAPTSRQGIHSPEEGYETLRGARNSLRQTLTAPTPAPLGAQLKPTATPNGTVNPPVRAKKYVGPPRIFAIGDSVMQGAAPLMQRTRSDIVVDALKGRQASTAIQILSARAAKKQLPGIVVVQIGNNGTFTGQQFDDMMKVLADVPHVIFLNLKVPRKWESYNNRMLDEKVKEYPNAILLDWRSYSWEHPDWFYDDGIHLPPDGASAYVNLIFTAIQPFLPE